MFYLRLIIFLFVAGTFNVVAVSLAYTLPALQGLHQEALAVTIAFVLFADAILLYVLIFKLSSVERYEEFDEILDKEKTGEEASQEEFDRAYRRWQDSK